MIKKCLRYWRSHLVSHLQFKLLGKVHVKLQLPFQRKEATEETVLIFLYASFDWSMFLSLLSGYPWFLLRNVDMSLKPRSVPSCRYGFLFYPVNRCKLMNQQSRIDPVQVYHVWPKKSNNRKLFNILSNPHQHLIKTPWILIGSSYRSTKTSNKKHPKVLSLTPWFQCLESSEFPSRLKVENNVAPSPDSERPKPAASAAPRCRQEVAPLVGSRF